MNENNWSPKNLKLELVFGNPRNEPLFLNISLSSFGGIIILFVIVLNVYHSSFEFPFKFYFDMAAL